MTHRAIRESVPDEWTTRVAFEVRRREYSFLEVLHGAVIRGDLLPRIERSRQAHACEQRAAREGRDPDMDAVEEMMDGFRYAHGLVTVEETEAWLDAHGLNADGLSDHFLRRYWDGIHDERTRAAAGDPDVVPPAWTADLLFTGNFRRLARSLAREAACATETPPLTAELELELLATFQHRSGLDPSTYAAWREDWNLEDPQVIDVLRAQHQFEQDRREVLSPARRAGMLSEFRSLLTQLELAVVEFDSGAAAHEAYLCVTADGISLEDIAAETGYPIRNEVAFLRELPEEWHPALLGAPLGRTLPPLPRGELFEVCRILRHTEPQLTDPSVVAELDGVLLERHFGRLESREVRWRIPMEGAA